MVKKLFICAAGLLTVFLGVWIGAGHTNAKSSLTEDEQEMFSQNNILFYEPCSTGAARTLSGDITISGSTAEEKVWSGLASFLTDEQAAGIMGNIGQENGNYNPLRREVGQGGGLWDKSAQMGLGLVQWSFGRRVNLLNYVKEQDSSLIKYFEDNSLAQMSGDDLIKKIGEDDVNKLYQLEIQFMKNEIDKGYKEYYKKTDIDDATIWFRAKYERAGVYSDEYRKQKAHSAYNKYAGKTITGSAGESGEVSDDSGDPCDAKVEGSKNINGTAVALAWPYGTDSSVYNYKQSNGLNSVAAYKNIAKWTGGKATDLFNKALDEVYPNRGWSQCPHIGASCDVFVGTVVRYSGYDKNFPRGVGTREKDQTGYAKAHPELWEVIDWDGDKSVLKAGDVINIFGSNGAHSYIVVQDEKGEFWIAEAGICHTFGHISKYHNPPSNRPKRYIIRAKDAKNSTVGIDVKNGVKTSSTTGTVTSGVGQGNMDIGATARYFAWPKGASAKDWKTHAYRAKEWEDFREASGKRKININGNLSSGEHISMGRSCVIFVWGVLKYAGLTKSFGGTEKLDREIKAQDDWVKVGTDVKVSEIQDGDVFFWTKKNSNGNPGHYGILIREDDGVHTIEASLNTPAYGRYKSKKYSDSDTFKGSEVWRNKKNKSGGGGSECNLCAGAGDEADGGDVGLKAGGLSLEEAKKLVNIYKGYAGENGLRGNTTIANKYYIKVGCHGNLFLNCPSFVKYFVNRYTTKKWTSGLTGDGENTYRYLANALGLKTGSVPRPYAVFSDNSYSPGHTGVVLGVDTARKKMIIGEAGCMSGSSTRAAYDFIGAHEVDINEYHLYTYLDPIINMEGV